MNVGVGMASQWDRNVNIFSYTEAKNHKCIQKKSQGQYKFKRVLKSKALDLTPLVYAALILREESSRVLSVEFIEIREVVSFVDFNQPKPQISSNETYLSHTLSG